MSFLFFALSFFGDRVITALAQRVTPENAVYGEEKALESAVRFNGLDSVARAGRIVAAHGRKMGRDVLAIKTNY